MHTPVGLRCVRSSRAWLLAGLTLATACSGQPRAGEEATEPGAAVAEAVSAGQPAQDSAPATARRFLPDEMRRSTRAETFPHEAHVQIDCAVCHEVAEGHGTHSSIECAECHRASASVTVRSLAPEQCAACHHGTEQTFTCEHCHESRGVVESRQQLALEVWSAPRSRTLAFDHGIHASVDCSRCHRSAPLLIPAEPCASCHEEHHAAGVRCVSCHTPPAAGAHDVQAHLTCSGAGCHRAPDVEALADTRAVCVVCHQAQEQHEPGGRCIECHRVRPEVSRRPGP